MTTLQVLELLNMVLRIAESAGVNYTKFTAARDKARAEGRELTAEDLHALSADAQAAIDKL